MKLKYVNNYLSISKFDPVELPNFTVLTGVNGSGKSHLLDAIEKKHVVLEGLNSPSIVKFNFETFKLENENSYNGQTISAEKADAWSFLQTQIKPQVQNLKQQIAPGEYTSISKECSVTKKPLWSVKSEMITPFKKNVWDFFKNNNIKQNHNSVGIFSLTKKLPYSIDEIRESDFMDLYKPYASRNDFLPMALGKIVWDYYIKYRNNQMNDFENSKYNKTNKVLSESEFIETHGEKPWEVINKILEKFDSLEYRVNSPKDKITSVTFNSN